MYNHRRKLHSGEGLSGPPSHHSALNQALPDTPITHALLDMERRAEGAMAVIQQDRDKLPARIAAEVAHVWRQASQEMDSAIQELKVKSKESTEARIGAVQEESARQMVDLEFDFAKYREDVRAALFKRITTWITMP